MPKIKATQQGTIHGATNSLNVLLPSSGQAKALKLSCGQSLVFYLDRSQSTSLTSPGFYYSASSSCLKEIINE